MNPFAWPVDWQALSTFTTGIAAVIGAVWVADRQNAIRRNELRIAMFDRRRETLQLFDELSGEWWRNARLSEEKLPALRNLVRDIELLFDDEVHSQARELFSDTVMQNLFADHVRLYREDDDERLPDAKAAKHEKLKIIADRLPRLREILVSATRVGQAFK